MGEEMKKAFIGFTSSSIATFLTYPMETIFRQCHVTSNSTTVRSLTMQMIKKPKLFYSGLNSALITQPLYWTLYMPIYPRLKETLKSSMAAGFVAGAVGTIATNPLWVMRQRLQTNLLYQPDGNSYRNVIRSMYKEGGLKVFFRGTQLTLVKNIQMAFLIPLFEYFTSSSSSIHLPLPIAAAASKIISSTGVYPLDVIRTNMRCQRSKANPSFVQTSKEIKLRPGGFLNFFRGIPLYWMSSASMFGIMMTIQNDLSNNRLS